MDCVNGVGYLPSERIMLHLEASRFRLAALIRMIDLKYNLISVLVEWWRPETYTFHLPCGECTITLEDIALQLGFPIDGFAVTSFSILSNLETFYYDLLGHSTDTGEDKLMSLRFTWLKANFEYLPNTATDQYFMCTARVYTMHIIGGVLMPNANKNKVHLTYLPLLQDLYVSISIVGAQ
ncbi:hypothetical protein PVK06_005685 [Gossypium arboreum]|uniref:Aminotransferase-like plant mobile domain-containing protein n=1 Tax=Gossypium arboreum TaxID=29729 RepID=A0ABR0QV84_GOSAR|nr:hypothetical protein PVK06_005685 [Gossypium arboreum]